MAVIKLKAKFRGRKYLPFEQDGKTYNLYDLPKGFVIKGDLDLHSKGLTELPDLSEVVVNGDFSCANNKLTSLKGAPKEVGGSFSCSDNKLTSLEGTPQKVGGSFSCSFNQLTSLDGAPQTVSGGFSCHNNQLTSLEGAPQKVRGSFDCHHNQLTSLDGSPKKVGGRFDCYWNQLTSLVGVPPLVGDNEIYCDDSLGAKYGFSSAKNLGISYEKLCASPLYKNELAMSRVRSKQQEKQVETKTQQQEQREKQQQEKINAEFSQWLKDNSNKPTRE